MLETIGVRALGLAAALSLLACASVSPPLGTMTAAEVAVREARQSDARTDARLELHQAEEHLAQAKEALQGERFGKARELAELALAEAELAKVKGEAARAERNLASIQADIDALQRELDRAAQR